MSHIIKRENLEIFGVVLFGIICFVYLLWFNYTNPKLVVRYDCSIAEISPDYPIAVKEGCRKLRAENFKENLQKPK